MSANSSDEFFRISKRPFEEKLSEAVRRFPVLYDKSNPGYKEKSLKEEAWETIAKELRIVGGALAADKLFSNLRKRYCKERLRMKKSLLPGRSSSEIDEIKQEVRMQYLIWLDPFLKKRRTKFKLQSLLGDQHVQLVSKPQNGDYYASEKNQVEKFDDFSSEIIVIENNELVASDGGTESFDNQRASVANSVTKKRPFSNTPGSSVNGKILKVTEGNSFVNIIPRLKKLQQQQQPPEQPLQQQRSQQQDSQLEQHQQHSQHQQQPMGSKPQQQRENEQKNEDQCDIFAQLVATQLKSLTKVNRLVAQNNIQNILFHAMMDEQKPTQNE